MAEGGFKSGPREAHYFASFQKRNRSRSPVFGVHRTTQALRELRVQLVLSLWPMEFVLALRDFQMQQSTQRNSVALTSLLSAKDAGSPTSCVAAVSHSPGLCAHCLVECVKVDDE